MQQHRQSHPVLSIFLFHPRANPARGLDSHWHWAVTTSRKRKVMDPTQARGMQGGMHYHLGTQYLKECKENPWPQEISLCAIPNHLQESFPSLPRAVLLSLGAGCGFLQCSLKLVSLNTWQFRPGWALGSINVPRVGAEHGCVESLLPHILLAAREEMILLLCFPSQMLDAEQQVCLRNQAQNHSGQPCTDLTVRYKGRWEWTFFSLHNRDLFITSPSCAGLEGGAMSLLCLSMKSGFWAPVPAHPFRDAQAVVSICLGPSAEML